MPKQIEISFSKGDWKKIADGLLEKAHTDYNCGGSYNSGDIRRANKIYKAINIEPIYGLYGSSINGIY